MGATVFVQPLDLVKNRMQLSGAGAKGREYRTSLHALGSILRHEGLRGIYTGYGPPKTPLNLQIPGAPLELPDSLGTHPNLCALGSAPSWRLLVIYVRCRAPKTSEPQAASRLKLFPVPPPPFLGLLPFSVFLQAISGASTPGHLHHHPPGHLQRAPGAFWGG